MPDEQKPDEAFDRPSRLTASEPVPTSLDAGEQPVSLTRRGMPMPMSDLPEPPSIQASLPPRPDVPQKGTVAPGGYQKLAVAATAASSFIAPIIVLGLGGWWLDQKLHLQPALLGFVGTLLGFVVGIISLMRVIKQLSK